MAEREVIWSETADKQLQQVLDYWLLNNASTEYPEKILGLVDEYIGYIVERPESFKRTEHKTNRVCVIGVFSIFFKIEKNNIYITCFWDNRQNPKKLKRILK